MASNTPKEPESQLIDVLIINTGDYTAYVDVDGNLETTVDNYILGPKGSVRAKVTEQRLDELQKSDPALVIKRLGE
nr:MAG TPA: hypothetical protein [Bacteriophage sp.]